MEVDGGKPVEGAIGFKDYPETVYDLAVAANDSAAIFGRNLDGGARWSDANFHLAGIA